VDRGHSLRRGGSRSRYGAVKILRYVVAEDCGEVINPAIVEGQIRGWVALGKGAVVLERSVYVDNGRFLTGSFMDYLLPTAADIPRIDVEHVQAILLDPDINFRGSARAG
jgi:aerobic carbon-monoxide dehydrogenase large subunit